MANENDKLKLAKSAQELKDDASIPTIKGKGEDEPEVSWEQAKEDLIMGPNFVCLIPPKETDTGIILPDGATLMDDDEYRPVAQKVGPISDDMKVYRDIVKEGYRLIMHPNAARQAIHIKFKGHKITLIHVQFVLGSEKNGV